jgi:hypothetical protein
MSFETTMRQIHAVHSSALLLQSFSANRYHPVDILLDSEYEQTNL